MSRLENAISGWLVAWAHVVRANAGRTVVLCLGATVGLLVYTAGELRVDSNTIALFPEHLPARQAHDAFVAEFPDLENALFIVVDGGTPEAARNAAARLAAALEADAANFDDVWVPSSGAFFERAALLYRSVDELEDFVDQLATLQPVLASLEQDRSVANLSRMIELGLSELDTTGSLAEPEAWADILDRVGTASVEVYEEFPLRVSWEELFVRGSSVETTRRQVIVAQPRLDFAALLPAEAALVALRRHTAELGLAGPGSVLVRATGNPAITYEETLGLLWDIGVAGIFCFALVAAILLRALRSARLVAALCLTLAVGLIWTAAFAAAAVGALNVISIAAGVLFVGLGVDFGIHLCMRYIDLLSRPLAHAEAWDQSLREIGSSLVICAITTSIGFLAFWPTDYRGVAELGLITAAGLVLVLGLTLTLLPAVLTLAPIDASRLEGRSFEFSERWSIPERAYPAIRWTALGLAIAATLLLPRMRFEPNIVAMRDPSTESVQTFNALLADANAPSPWHANSIAPDLESAAALADALSQLSVVSRSVSLLSYVPDEQETKREILEEAAFLLEPVPTGGASAASPEAMRSAPEQVAALRRLRDVLRAARPRVAGGALASSVSNLDQQLTLFLDRVAEDATPERAIAELENVLLASLPEQLERLRASFDPPLITLDTLPPRLVARMRTADGRARVQTFPSANLGDASQFSLFVDQVHTIDPNATGVAANLVAFARTTLAAFQQALTGAVVAIALVLGLLWRRAADVAIALGPLLLAGLLTAASLVLLAIPFSFFNVVVIPLILGAGVDSAIHLVQSARGEEQAGDLLGTTTARAVWYSALTTITSFGTLALSAHRGLSGLGVLLTVGMLLMLACNLVVLPALLGLRKAGDA